MKKHCSHAEERLENVDVARRDRKRRPRGNESETNKIGPGDPRRERERGRSRAVCARATLVVFASMGKGQQIH